MNTCPPGCDQYTPEQGCTYHGTLPKGCCEAHTVKDCSECADYDETPTVHVDWEMTPEEWEQLRTVLTKPYALHQPYIRKLWQEGKLG